MARGNDTGWGPSGGWTFGGRYRRRRIGPNLTPGTPRRVGPGKNYLPGAGPQGPPITRGGPGFGAIKPAPNPQAFLKGKSKADIAAFMKAHKGEGMFPQLGKRMPPAPRGRPKPKPFMPPRPGRIF